MFINIFYKFKVMGLFSWILGLISGGGSKSADTLKQKDDKLEVLKSKFRIMEDKIRLKQAKEKSKEDKGVTEEVEETRNILRGETPKAEMKDAKKLIHGDIKIEGELRKDEVLASKVVRIGKVIKKIDRKEEANEAQIGRMTGRRSQASVEEQQDIQTQENLTASERKRIQDVEALRKIYWEKKNLEGSLFETDRQIKNNKYHYAPYGEQKVIEMNKNYEIRRIQVLGKIKQLEEQIMRYKESGITYGEARVTYDDIPKALREGSKLGRTDF